MLVKLFFGERVAPEEVQALLEQYRSQALARRNQFAADAAADADAIALDPESPRRFGRAAALFGLRRAEADLAWLDEMQAELQLPNLDGDAAADDRD